MKRYQLQTGYCYIVRTVQMLTGILHRMQAHQAKKNDLLRALQVAQTFAAVVDLTESQ